MGGEAQVWMDTWAVLLTGHASSDPKNVNTGALGVKTDLVSLTQGDRVGPESITSPDRTGVLHFSSAFPASFLSFQVTLVKFPSSVIAGPALVCHT